MRMGCVYSFACWAIYSFLVGSKEEDESMVAVPAIIFSTVVGDGVRRSKEKFLKSDIGFSY